MTKPRSKQIFRISTTAKASDNQLRIIAGKWRGRKLQFPSVAGLRPTGDRIRETLFNWLAPYLHGAQCLDLFAGSGALGFEALSRGASHATLIENNVKAANTLRTHIDTLTADACVIEQDALHWLSATAPKVKFDVVFVDPPFTQSLWSEVIPLLTSDAVLADGALIYIESPSDFDLVTIPAHWELWREKSAGQVAFRVFRHHNPR